MGDFLVDASPLRLGEKCKAVRKTEIAYLEIVGWGLVCARRKHVIKVSQSKERCVKAGTVDGLQRPCSPVLRWIGCEILIHFKLQSAVKLGKGEVQALREVAEEVRNRFVVLFHNVQRPNSD